MLTVLLFLLAGVSFGLAGLYASLTADLPPLALVPAYFDPQYGAFYHPTRLLDRSGQHTFFTLENPGITPEYLVLDPERGANFSPQLIQSVISLLQPDFWQSPGFSFQHWSSPTPQTLAERLANDLLLAAEPTGLRRNLRMRLLAAQLTAEYGRAQVLEWYLNAANFGHTAFGAGTAARLYLDRSAAELDLAQASLLTAILDAPALNPLDAPAAALERQQAALNRLLENGAISAQNYQAAAAAKLVLRTALPEPNQAARAFSRLVIDEISNKLGAERLERGGWTIRTTLDADLQVQLVCSLQTQIQRLEEHDLSAVPLADCPAARLIPTLNLKTEPVGSAWDGSAAILDPQTGQLLALAGDTTATAESALLSSRPVGSLLSPLAAVGLFAGGYSPASLTWDIPNSLGGQVEALENPDGIFHGPQRLRTALVNDYLAGLAGLLEQNGAANIWRRVEPLGLVVDSGSQALFGAQEFNPIQVAQAFAPLANGGVQAGVEEGAFLVPNLILEVKSSSELLPGFGSAQTRPLLSPSLTYLAQSVLSDETARRASLGYPNPLEIGRPVGAKLGQTRAGDDIWALGFTPQRLVVVRLSRQPDAAQPRLDVRLAAGLWHALMQTASRELPTLTWAKPAGITTLDVCDPSGLLPTVNCPVIVEEIFLTGNEPTAPDDLYRKLQINRETGLLATVFTPPGLVEEKVFFFAPPQAQAWAEQQGLDQPPIAYDLVQAQPAEPGVAISSPVMFAAVKGEIPILGSAALAGMDSYTVQVGQGMNPARWVEIGRGDFSIKDDELALWQTPAEDGLYAIRLVVVGADLSLHTAISQVTVDNTPPQVRLIYPTPGLEVQPSPAKTLTLAVEAADALGIRSVEWRLDGRSLGLQTEPPYQFPWAVTSGTHRLSVRVVDLAGNLSETPEVEFTVK